MSGVRKRKTPPFRKSPCHAGSTKRNNVLSTLATNRNLTRSSELSQIAEQLERSSMQSIRLLATRSLRSAVRRFFLVFLVTSLPFPALTLRGATGGSISGTVTDQSGAVLPDATLELLNTGQLSTYHARSDRQGLYSFPNLSVGHYDLTITATGFTTQRKTDLTVDTDSALRVDASLAV